MDKIRKLILENKAWSLDKTNRDPEYFSNMAKGQSPDFLWIGCSDSRVDPSELTNSQPGEMFVHRNIANLVQPNDLNLQSVIQYAVEALKVSHIIICGHYECGGVRASMGTTPFRNVNQWIGSIRELYEANLVVFEKLPSEKERVNQLVEMNVMSQVKNLAQTATIQNAWAKEGIYPIIHGWVYDLHTGSVRSLITVDKTYWDKPGLSKHSVLIENADQLGA